MLNKKTLSLKLNKSFQSPQDGPFTPVEQTLSTPVDLPNHNSYFGQAAGDDNQHPLYMHPQYNESDDIMTDVDDSQSKVSRSYSIAFTPSFDSLVMNVYSYILSLPTTTPFSGYIPPSGLASRVANETLSRIISETESAAESGRPVYDLHGVLTYEQLSNPSSMPIVLQLIRKRLIDLCTNQKGSKAKSGSTSCPTVTSVVIMGHASHEPHSTQQGSSVYNGSGLRQSSISNLSLNEQNISSYQQNQLAQNNQSSQYLNSRSRSSSINLRKHSLTRNNSNNGTNWLHVGNMANVRPGGNLGSNPEFGASTDSLQSMNDYVPHALLPKSGGSSSNLTQGWGSGTFSGFNSMMMDYQTPPSSNKGSFSYGSCSPSAANRDNLSQISGSSNSDSETMGPSLLKTRSLSRGGSICTFPKPLTINTQTNAASKLNSSGGATEEMLHSPFVSAVTPSEDFGYFGSQQGQFMLENALPVTGGLRSGSLSADNSVKEINGNKINIPSQYALSEKKRDSLKMKRGIH